FLQPEDGIRHFLVTGVQTFDLPIYPTRASSISKSRVIALDLVREVGFPEIPSSGELLLGDLLSLESSPEITDRTQPGHCQLSCGDRKSVVEGTIVFVVGTG